MDKDLPTRFVKHASLFLASLVSLASGSHHAESAPANITNPAVTAVAPPLIGQPFGSNWFGFLPTNALFSFTNGVVYVDATNGNDLAAGDGPGTNAFKHIYQAVNSTTNTLVWVSKGSYTETITNVNAHGFQFDSGATNIVNGSRRPMFLTASNDLYVGGSGSFIVKGGGNVVSWVSSGDSVPQRCQFQAAFASSGNDIFDTIIGNMVLDIMLGSFSAPDGQLFDHVGPGVTINLFGPARLVFENDPQIGAAATYNFINCDMVFLSQAALQGTINVYGGTWSATNGFIYGDPSASIGSINFYGTSFDVPSSLPVSSPSEDPSLDYKVGGYGHFQGGVYFQAK